MILTCDMEIEFHHLPLNLNIPFEIVKISKLPGGTFYGQFPQVADFQSSGNLSIMDERVCSILNHFRFLALTQNAISTKLQVLRQSTEKTEAQETFLKVANYVTAETFSEIDYPAAWREAAGLRLNDRYSIDEWEELIDMLLA